jgi:hypothetical protein
MMPIRTCEDVPARHRHILAKPADVVILKEAMTSGIDNT